MTATTGKARDPFNAARDEFVMAVLRHVQGEAATKVAIALAVNFASRAEFERSGRLVAWPSLRTLAEMVGMFRGRLSRGLEVLDDGGWLTIERPEKRGVGHHFTYVMNVVEAAPAAVEAPKRKQSDTRKATATGGAIGLTTVANSNAAIGLGPEANQQAAIGLTGEDELASPARPNLLEDTLDGAGALGARLPDTRSGMGEDHNVLLIEDDATEAEGGGARDRAPATNGPSSDAATAAVPEKREQDVDAASAAIHNEKGGRRLVTLEDLDRLAEEEAAALGLIPAPSRPASARPDPWDDLRPLGLSGDDLDLLRDAMTSAGADGAAHALSAPELTAAFAYGFVHGDPAQRERAVEDVAGVLDRLAQIGEVDDTTTLPAEHAANLCRVLRYIARKADRAAPGEVGADDAIRAFSAAIGHPNAIPAPAIPEAAQASATAPHDPSPPDRITTATHDLAALFGDRLPRPGDLVRDLRAGLAQADLEGLRRAVAVVRAVASPNDWPRLMAVADGLVPDGGDLLLGIVTDAEMEGAEID